MSSEINIKKKLQKFFYIRKILKKIREIFKSKNIFVKKKTRKVLVINTIFLLYKF